MSKDESNNSIISGLFWRFGERIGAQTVTFVVSLVIARILEPSAYGVISILLVFITFADVFVTGGFGNALIQKKDADNLDFSSVFFFNIAFSTVIFIVLFAIAPLVEFLYGEAYHGLAAALRILAIRVPITAINNVQQAYVSRKMIFKKFFFSTLLGTIGAAIIGIGMALMGMGIWAIVSQYLFNAIVNTIFLWFTVRWRPEWEFSFARLKILINYGWKLLAAQILDTTYNNIRTLIIGKIYTSEDLAYYNKGTQFPSLFIDSINTTIISVMFPAISSIQHDKIEIKRLVRKSVQVSSYIIIPVMTGLAIISNPLIELILTDKWLPAVPYLQIFCLVYVLQPITKANLQVIKAVGRSDLYLILEIIKKVIGLSVFFIFMQKSVVAIAIGFALSSILNCIMDMVISGKLINYAVREQIADMLPPTLISFAMVASMWGAGRIPLNSMLTMLIQILAGVAVYISLSIITNNKNFEFIVQKIQYYIKAIVKRRHKYINRHVYIGRHDKTGG